MLVVIDTGQILTHAANGCMIVAGLYGFWRFMKREWRRPDPPDE